MQDRKLVCRNDRIDKKSVTHNLCLTTRPTGKLDNWITNILSAKRYTLYADIRDTIHDSRDTIFYCQIYFIRSIILQEYPHSLSYQAIILTKLLSTTIVDNPSIMEE